MAQNPHEKCENRRKKSSIIRKTKDLIERIKSSIIASSHVVCTTCVGTSLELSDRLFGLIIVDEATQCSEPEVIIPLVQCRRDGQVGTTLSKRF